MKALLTILAFCVLFTITLLIFKFPLLFIEGIAEHIYEEYGSGWTVFLVMLLGGVVLALYFQIILFFSSIAAIGYEKFIDNAIIFYITSVIAILLSLRMLYNTWFVIETLTFPYLGVILKICYTITIVMLNSVIIYTGSKISSKV
ncbi:MAG: hypothetical protein U0V74_08700 [Chitinophagales bacterium]